MRSLGYSRIRRPSTGPMVGDGSQTMEEAETAGQLIIAEAQAAQQDCPHKVVGVQRDYEAAYDGQRSGIYIHN